MHHGTPSYLLTILFPGCLWRGFQTVKNILENMWNILQPPVAKSRRNTYLDFFFFGQETTRIVSGVPHGQHE